MHAADIDERILLIGCSVFHKEIKFLVRKNAWPVDVHFLDSALHIDFAALSSHLTTALQNHRGRNTVVFYGACHPLMDRMLAEAKTIRTVGQNCVDILLGTELFTAELAQGAFFLFEDWARRWEYIMVKTFGSKQAIWREIFEGDRSCLLCVRTPCSADFAKEAEAAGKALGLPLRWLDVSLDHLEAVLREVLFSRRSCENANSR